jgi:hypothetical protein
LIIVTFAFIGILAFVGLAIDLGWVFVERVRVAQAADAAALAGASELPLEEPARRRAAAYLKDNGYDPEADDVQVIYDAPTQPPDDENYSTTIWIDTAYSRDRGLADTSDRIRVRVRREVFMTFMQFIGFRWVPVEATAQAENINNIDTVIVYDRSGSMQFDTLCFGCWEPVEDAPYPSGIIYPLWWSATPSDVPDHCLDNDTYYKTGDQGDVETGEIYMVIEAEEYSFLSVDYTVPAPLTATHITKAITTPYQTYWVLQRNQYNDFHGVEVGALGRDAVVLDRETGAYLSHHPFAQIGPFLSDGMGVPCTWADLQAGYCRSDFSYLPEGSDAPDGPLPAPRADYDFVAPRAGNYYVWIRGQGGYGDQNSHIFWGLDGSPRGEENGFPEGAAYDGARGDRWEWRRLSAMSGGDAVFLGAGSHTLNLWAGGAGFDVDRIVITTDNVGSLPSDVQTMPPHNGRTGSACDPCDPRFAGRPGGFQGTNYYRPDCVLDQRFDAIYDDQQPIRGALEAAKYFVNRLDPGLDQVGYVPYSDNAEIRNELECLRRLGPDDCTDQVFADTVLWELDRTRTENRTNTAEGMKFGIDVLGIDLANPPPYGRPGSAHVMVLLTDGRPTATPAGGGCGGPEECVEYYAKEARNNGIVVYTIGLGRSADQILLAEVAAITEGQYYPAPETDDLKEIFDELYERIFLRLIR